MIVCPSPATQANDADSVMQLTGPSIDAPRPGREPPEPAWQSFPDFKDHVHPRQLTAGK